MAIDWQGVQREAYRIPGLFLGQSRGVSVERWLRGREEWHNLQRSQAALVSFGCSGRTWLRVMMSHALALEHGLTTELIIEGSNFRQLSRDIPSVFFTHDNYIRDYTDDKGGKSAFSGVATALLVRHPADIAVSQYYQWKYRMRARKRVINSYPAPSDMPLAEFVFRDECGIPKIIRYLNEWATELPKLPRAMFIRYEDLRTNAEAEVSRLLDFIGAPAQSRHVAAAVRFASIENMRKMEDAGVGLIASGRSQKDRSTQNSYKARKAKAGGYKDELSASDVAMIDALIAETLHPLFNYAATRQQ